MALTKVTMGLLSGLVDKITATVRSLFNVSGDAPMFACRAWVNFDGTTTPPTIRASGNVSSVVRNSTGDFTVNFTTAMDDVNYSVQAHGGGALSTSGGSMSTTSCGINAYNTTGTALANLGNINVVVFR